MMMTMIIIILNVYTLGSKHPEG